MGERISSSDRNEGTSSGELLPFMKEFIDMDTLTDNDGPFVSRLLEQSAQTGQFISVMEGGELKAVFVPVTADEFKADGTELGDRP